MPIITVTAKTEPDDIVRGLKSGADDYVVKSFRSREVLARVRARLGRLAAGKWTGDHQRHSVLGSADADLRGRDPSQRDLELALSIDDRHINARGLAHGGVLSTLADVALGYATAGSQYPPARLITASLTIDFVEPVELGETIVARTDIQRIGGRRLIDQLR